MGELDDFDSGDPLTDGRHERVRQGKAKVVAASIDLVVEGNRDISVEQLAERAGISPRTVVRYFETYNELIDEGVSQMYGRVAHLFTNDVPDLPLPERLRRFVSLRLDFVRTYHPLIEAMKRAAPRFPAAAEAVALRDRLLSQQFDSWFAVEKQTCDEARCFLFEMFLHYESVFTIESRFAERTEDIIVRFGLELLGQAAA